MTFKPGDKVKSISGISNDVYTVKWVHDLGKLLTFEEYPHSLFTAKYYELVSNAVQAQQNIVSSGGYQADQVEERPKTDKDKLIEYRISVRKMLTGG